LVRPNQGLIEPGGEQKVQILLVEKDKNSLLQSYERLGQSALDHSKDKFLVQSVAVLDAARASQLRDYDQLTALWASVGSTPSPSVSAIANKKLHVKHVVAEGSKGSVAPDGATASSPGNREPIDNMTGDQVKVELGVLRRKYDELVAFSVNLTAERDMLNNSLEQTRRDLSRELSRSAAHDNARGRSGGLQISRGTAGTSVFLMLIVAVMAFIAGVKVHQQGLLAEVPFLGNTTAPDMTIPEKSTDEL